MSDPKKIEKEVLKMEPAKPAKPAEPAKKEVAKKEEVKAAPKAAAAAAPKAAPRSVGIMPMDIAPPLVIIRPACDLLPANPSGNPRFNPGTCGQVVGQAPPIDWKTPSMVLSP